jgi:type VI secretion system protein ImpK
MLDHYRNDRLALLYEGILTAIVRLQYGRDQLQGSDSFRQRIKDALKDIGDKASRRGYDREMVEDASFAVVAFLDEVILSSHGSGQAHWARKNLQEELFNQRSAGEFFFKRLEELRAHHDSSQLAETLEVYYLCLLLGYEGRYAAGSKAELHLMMDNLREKIERVLGREAGFSPDWQLPEAAPATPRHDPLPNRIRLAAIGMAALALLCFLGFSLHLGSGVGNLERAAQQHAAR